VRTSRCARTRRVLLVKRLCSPDRRGVTNPGLRQPSGANRLGCDQGDAQVGASGSLLGKASPSVTDIQSSRDAAARVG